MPLESCTAHRQKSLSDRAAVHSSQDAMIAVSPLADLNRALQGRRSESEYWKADSEG